MIAKLAASVLLKMNTLFGPDLSVLPCHHMIFSLIRGQECSGQLHLWSSIPEDCNRMARQTRLPRASLFPNQGERHAATQ